MTPDELVAHKAAVADATLDTARAIASDHLARSLSPFGFTQTRITKALTQRDSADPDFELLAPYEKRWATLVLRLLDPVAPQHLAVQDALSRGATWAEIGNALGISRQAAHRNFHKKT